MPKQPRHAPRRRRDRSEGPGRAALSAALGAGAWLAALAAATPASAQATPVVPPGEPHIGADKPYHAGSATIGSDGCDVRVDTIWTDAFDGRYRLEARSIGESCASAELTLAIRAPSQRVIMRETFEAETVAGFARATDPRRMRGAIIDWITNRGNLDRNTTDLPSWVEAQFSRLTLNDEMTREEYQRLLDEALPMYCYDNSPTTMNCVALETDGRNLTQIGTVSLPGSG